MPQDRLSKLYARRIDPTVAKAGLLHEVYHRLHATDSVRYVVGAMQPIDPEYTATTYAEANRVSNQLSNRLATGCDYEFQGSVTNDTHIRAKSDIDLLALIQRFYTLEHPQIPTYPYQGDPIQDLTQLRNEIIAALTAAFPEATVRKDGTKSIPVEGGSLRRRVDVVPANWYDTNHYANTGLKTYRGVQILDTSTLSRTINTPFVHNARIEQKDAATGGGLRKAARLMKSLKYDRETIDLTSYDIVSLAYNIPPEQLYVPQGAELTLLASCVSYCEYLNQDHVARSALRVPDGHRAIFCEGHATVQGFSQLTLELQSLASDVLQENARSFRKLAEARVAY
jgi:hypothetical protein